ncbi:MAG TPA: phosphate ABC transporter permease PstA [Dictyobacter sp.]|jgi:phosphate transport system permease protein|nr:phosphate ABC transporter permease PstA [Dictyobacter sp.]
MSTQQQVSPGTDAQGRTQLAALERIVKRLHGSNNVASVLLWLITGLITLFFVAIVVYLLVQGVPYLLNPDFYLANGGTGDVGQQIFNTLYILVLTEIILVPISLAAAIYLIEYAPKGPLVSIIHFAAETLSGIPSIVLGLFGALIFVSELHMGFSRLAGALTLLCLNFPIALRLFEDALSSVPNELREGSLALGTTKWHMIRTVVLPSALPGIVTGIVLSAGKIIAEAAALIYTMGTANPANVVTLNPLIGGDTLTVHVWYLKTIGAGFEPPSVANAVSAGASALLIILLFLINIVARMLGNFIQRRATAA